jgi:hypothetical protein
MRTLSAPSGLDCPTLHGGLDENEVFEDVVQQAAETLHQLEAS